MHNKFNEDLTESNYQANWLFLFSFLSLRFITLSMAAYYWHELPTGKITSANVLVPPGIYGQIPNLLYGAIGISLFYSGFKAVFKASKNFLLYKDLNSIRRIIEGLVVGLGGFFVNVNVWLKLFMFIDPSTDLNVYARITAMIVWHGAPLKGIYDFFKNIFNWLRLSKRTNDIHVQKEIMNIINTKRDRLKETCMITGVYAVSLAGGYAGIVLNLLDIKTTLILQSGVGIIPNIWTGIRMWTDKKELAAWSIQKNNLDDYHEIKDPRVSLESLLSLYNRPHKHIL